MSKTCPHCGQTIPEVPREFADLKLTPQQSRILARVCKAGKHGISSDILIDWLYADRDDGGPMGASRVLHNQVCRMNRELCKIGWQLRATRGGAHFEPGVYSLRHENAC